MKKVFLCLVLIGMIFNISAQEAEKTQTSLQRHEVCAGFGLLNDNQMIAMIGDVLATVFTLGYLVEPNEYKAFTPFVGYRYNLAKRFSIGGLLAFDSNSVKVAQDKNENGKLDENEMLNKQIVKRRYITFAVEPKFNYIAKPSFQLYGYFGLGMTVVKFGKVNKFANGEQPEVDNRLPHINAHFTPIGMRFGKDFGGFVEFGYGYKGIINAGFSYRF